MGLYACARIHGTIQTTDSCITPNAFCDYVFDENYPLMLLKKLQQYIANHKHLPEILTEKEVVTNGLKLNEIILLQMKKIEELSLHIIEQNNRIEALEKKANK